MVCHCLGKHGFASAWGPPQEHAPGRVNSNLSVQLVMCQRQLHSLLDLLLLYVVATNVLQEQSSMSYILISNVFVDQKREGCPVLGRRRITHLIQNCS